MRIAVYGTGYLGATHAACMAEFGHEVVGVDIDPAKVERLERGEAPFFEPGLPELLQRHTSSGRLRFTADYGAAVRSSDVHFIAVGTPQRAGSMAADLRQVDAVVDRLAPMLDKSAIVLGKSTVPASTASRIALRLNEVTPSRNVAFGWNPEFLREGTAVGDTLLPDRIVIGVEAVDSDRVVAATREIYSQPLTKGTPLVVTDLATAELVKVAANSFLAMKVSFINSVAEVCDAVGADVSVLAAALGLDDRIGGRYLRAGVGYGGACLPKDVRAFQARAAELGAPALAKLLSDVDWINGRQRDRVTELVRDVSRDREEPVVAVVGLTFKPDSDDVRDSPALDVASRLAGMGCRVQAWDPQGISNARRAHPGLDYRASLLEACDGADVVVAMTEWAQVAAMEPQDVAAVARGHVVIDARNCLDKDAWTAAGWVYRGVGR